MYKYFDSRNGCTFYGRGPMILLCWIAIRRYVSNTLSLHDDLFVTTIRHWTWWILSFIRLERKWTSLDTVVSRAVDSVSWYRPVCIGKRRVNQSRLSCSVDGTRLRVLWKRVAYSIIGLFRSDTVITAFCSSMSHLDRPGIHYTQLCWCHRANQMHLIWKWCANRVCEMLLAPLRTVQ